MTSGAQKATSAAAWSFPVVACRRPPGFVHAGVKAVSALPWAHVPVGDAPGVLPRLHAPHVYVV